MTELPDRLRQPALGELWNRAWRELGRAGDRWRDVKLRVPAVGDDERHALSGLLGRPVAPGTGKVSVRLAELDDAVRRPGDGWDLVAVVEVVVGPVPDHRGDAATKALAIDEATAAMRRTLPPEPWVDGWLDGLRRDGKLGRLAGRGELHLLLRAAAMLAELPVAGEPLPSFANRLTGDTKALSGTPLAGLVLAGIGARLGEGPRAPRAASGKRARWEAVGVVPDDLASQVLVLNLPVVADPGLAGWLAEAACDGEPVRLTLHQLVRYRVPVGAEPGPVFVCENPAVLRAAAERLGAGSAALVCTEGQPSVAAARLLDGLVAGGARLRVRADFDWTGVGIAGSLLARPGASPWRFGAVDYEAARRRRVERPRPLAGAAVVTPWDPGLERAMTAAGEVVYEEELLDELVTDLDRR